MRFPGLFDMLEVNHWTSLDTNIPKRKTKILGREIATERSTKSGQNTEEIYFSKWTHSDKLPFLVPVIWVSKSRDTLKRINLQEDENENEVGGTPVVRSERLAERKLDLLSNAQKLLQQKQIRKCPYQMNLKLQNVRLFSLCCQNRINATEEQLKNAYLTYYLEQRYQQICQQIESSATSNEFLIVALILVYHSKGSKAPTTFRDNLTWICLANDFLYFLQYLYIV